MGQSILINTSLPEGLLLLVIDFKMGRAASESGCNFVLRTDEIGLNFVLSRVIDEQYL
jgi:hypothetical protein